MNGNRTERVRAPAWVFGNRNNSLNNVGYVIISPEREAKMGLKEELIAEAIDYSDSTMTRHILDEQANFNKVSEAFNCSSYGRDAMEYVHKLLAKMGKSIGDIIAKEKSALTNTYVFNGGTEVQTEDTLSTNDSMLYPVLLTKADLDSFCIIALSTIQQNVTLHVEDEIHEMDKYITDVNTDSDVITICQNIKRIFKKILDAENEILNDELKRFNA